jgi:hypothetical protein
MFGSYPFEMIIRQWRHGGARRLAVVLLGLGLGGYIVLFFLQFVNDASFGINIPGTRYVFVAMIVAFFVGFLSMIYLARSIRDAVWSSGSVWAG